MQPATLAARARNIRFSQNAIADAAQLNPNTVARTLAGRTDPRNRTLTAIADAIVAEEKRLRDDLIDLHGLPERDAFVVGGVPRRVVMPAMNAREDAA